MLNAAVSNYYNMQGLGMKTQIDLDGKTYCLIEGSWMGPDLREPPRAIRRQLRKLAEGLADEVAPSVDPVLNPKGATE